MRKFIIGTAISAVWAATATAQVVPSPEPVPIDPQPSDIQQLWVSEAPRVPLMDPTDPGMRQIDKSVPFVGPRMEKALVNGQDRAYVDQSGTRNSTDIDQSGNRNVSDTIQLGEGNKLEVDQIAGASPNSAVITQEGSLNRGKIHQDGRTGDGRINKADIDQAGVGHRGEIRQFGGGNLARMDQGRSWVGTDNTRSYIEQVGNGNRAWHIHSADGSRASTKQFGDNNLSTIGRAAGVASHVQVGTGNVAFSNDFITDVGSESSIAQFGEGNFARHFQGGNLNTARTYQDGVQNMSSVLQTGSDWANVQQFGVGNMSVVTQ